MESPTLKKARICLCKPEDTIHHPVCCFKCSFCGLKIPHEYIREHETDCQAQHLARLGKIQFADNDE
jgi:hypothetical protein